MPSSRAIFEPVIDAAENYLLVQFYIVRDDSGAESCSAD